MKTHLLYADRSLSVLPEYPYDKTLLLSDLELDVLLSGMAGDDAPLREACQAVLLQYSTDREEILYRQEILREVLAHPEFAREMYAVAAETLYRRKKEHVWLQSQLNALFRGAVEILRMTMEQLRKLRSIADKYTGTFRSAGLVRLLADLRAELSDDYFAEVDAHLEELSFHEGMLLSATFGDKLQGTNYTMRRLSKKGLMRRWLFAPGITISSKDEEGLADLEVRKARVLSQNVNILARATDHVLSFFTTLRDEIGFYVGCLNLKEALTQAGISVCIPQLSSEPRSRVFSGLVDASLPLIGVKSVVGNDFDYTDKALYVVTGANQGGKSTFLRSIGQSQLMLQAGMFVAAKHYTGPVSTGLFTHFRKEEDAKMDSGKLDEELARMSRLVCEIRPGATVLFNESFAATNEREGAEIGRQITQALLDSQVEVFTVTHLYQLSRPFYEQKDPRFVFLRAQRLSDGTRSFRLAPGEPETTGYGDDVFARVFGD